MSLTDATLKNAKAKDKPYKLFDSGGLFILVHSNGSKYWRFKYRFEGKEKLLSLGKYPKVKLKEAREALGDYSPMIGSRTVAKLSLSTVRGNMNHKLVKYRLDDLAEQFTTIENRH